MKYLSVCSGIEAATVAWHHMGWKPVGFSEIESFPSKVLAHHYPDVTNFGDMTKFKEWKLNDTVELLVGGTPCQSFSVAGLRKGLADPRGNLMLTYLAMANHFKPKWLLWENVPGVLSSNRGADFAALLQGMAECGYGFAYRVLDAQYFGVPQRRRRVFVVGCLGDWRSAAKILFESESLCRDITPRRGEGQEVANCLTKSPSSHSGFNPASHEGNGVIWPAPIASTLNASFGEKQGLENQHINQGAPLFVQSVYENHGTDSRIKEVDVCPTMTSRYGTGGNNIPLVQAVDIYNGSIQGDVTATLTAAGGSSTHSGPKVMVAGFLPGQGSKAHGLGYEVEMAPTLRAGCSSYGLHQSMRVRRLTPKECERLQGFPDDYTNIPNAPDTGRYKALGNSMAVPVMRWIGERINEVENGRKTD